jgi:hypothetical protein
MELMEVMLQDGLVLLGNYIHISLLSYFSSSHILTYTCCEEAAFTDILFQVFENSSILTFGIYCQIAGQIV